MEVGNDLIDPQKQSSSVISLLLLLSFAPWRRLPFPSRKMHNPIWTWQEREGQQLETRRLLCYWRVAGVAVEASTSIPWECKFDGFLPFNIFLSLNAFFNFYPASQFSRIIWKKSKSHLNFRAKIYFCSCMFFGTNNHCILNGQKLNKNIKNGPIWRVFEKLKLAVNQCYQITHCTAQWLKITQKCLICMFGIFHQFLSYLNWPVW